MQSQCNIVRIANPHLSKKNICSYYMPHVGGYAMENNSCMIDPGKMRILKRGDCLEHVFASELYDIQGQYAGSYIFWYDMAQERYLKIVDLDDLAEQNNTNPKICRGN